MIVYDKFFDLLKSRGISINKALKDANLSMGVAGRLKNSQKGASAHVIDSLCLSLGVQPSDICEVISEEEYASRIEMLQKQEIENLERRVEFLKSQKSKN